MRAVTATLSVAGLLALGACAVQPPQGPSIAVMPGKDKTYAQFQDDDLRCRQTAFQANGGVSNTQASNQSAVNSAVLGTALGAGVGALLGSTGGAVGAGAAIGAGTGLVAGSALGAGAAQASSADMQRSYDITYAQCMTAAGNSVPQPTAAAGYAPGYPVYAPAYVYGPPVYVEPPPVAVGFGFGWGRPYWHRHYW